MLFGIKETCTEAESSHRGHELPLVLPLRNTHKISVTVQEDVEDTKIANLISKLNFYKLIPYPMDNSLSGRRRPARQTSEKDVLCLH